MIRIKLKRIYDEEEPGDGKRILVDRLWPRGISKKKANIHFWAREVAPSNELRKWYGHDPGKWSEFRRRYYEELISSPDALEALRACLVGECVTFLFSSREQKLNNAVALKAYVEKAWFGTE